MIVDILFVFAEIITPVADLIVTPLPVMAPLIILYELSILLGKKVEASHQPASARSASLTGPSR